MSKSTNSAMTHAGCGTGTSKASYAANVYEVRDGHQYAVCNGQTFEVTATTPYAEVGNARYYFADEESRVRCSEKMKAMATELDKEAVSLATAEANVTVDNGQKYGICPVTNDKFLVTADSPAKVVDGQKYYVCSDKCASQMLHTADNPQSH
jgi:YHS domain-containing protein